MLFVDGENFTIQAERRLKELDAAIESVAEIYSKGVYFWPKGILSHWGTTWSNHVNVARIAERNYYYSSVTGNDADIDSARDALRSIRFTPVIFKKKQGTRAKGVDVCLTKDLLVNAFHNNYDVAVLVAGDGDYVPVIEEVQRFGKHVVVSFFSDPKEGLNMELRRAADQFDSLDDLVKA